MIYLAPGRLPSCTTRADQTGRAGATVHAEAVRAARETLPPKKASFLNRLLGRHSAKHNTSTGSPVQAAAVGISQPKPSAFSFPKERLDELGRRFGHTGLLRWVRSKQSAPDFTRVLDAARALSRCDPDDAYRPARQLQETLKGYLTPKRLDRWEALVDKNNRAAKAADMKQVAVLEMRQAVDELLVNRFSPNPRAYPNDPVAQRVATERQAAILARHGATSTAEAGTSDVVLIKTPQKQVAYAFKPMKGESPQNFAPPGGAAMREKMCSVLNDEVLNTTGLDFGFPKVQLGTHEGEFGALIEGINGRTMDAHALAINAAPSEAGLHEVNRTRKLWTTQVTRIQARELQKVMLANLAMGNVDVKWGNMLVDLHGNCRPIDGGSAFPTRCALARISYQGMAPDKLCDGPIMGSLPAGDEPMDPALRTQFLAINTKALASTLLARRRELLDQQPPDLLINGEAPDRERMLDEDAVLAGIASLELTQRILRETPDCSMRTLAQRYITGLQAAVPTSDVEAYQRMDETHSFNTMSKQKLFMASFDREVAGEMANPARRSVARSA